MNILDAMLYKTLEDKEKCKDCQHMEYLIKKEYNVPFCYRKWFLGKECVKEVAE